MESSSLPNNGTVSSHQTLSTGNLEGVNNSSVSLRENFARLQLTSRINDANRDTSSSSSSSRNINKFEKHDLREYICGWGAALINITTTFPINKIMFRQMVHGVQTRSAIEQLRREGWANLYKGLLPPLMSKTASVSLMFGSYSSFRRYLDKHTQHLLPSSLCRLSLAALLSGSAEAILCPFERIQMLLQSREYGREYGNTFRAMKLLKNYGTREFYRGFSAVLLRNGPSNVMFFAVRENWQLVFTPSHNYYMNLFEHFVAGKTISL